MQRYTHQPTANSFQFMADYRRVRGEAILGCGCARDCGSRGMCQPIDFSPTVGCSALIGRARGEHTLRKRGPVMQEMRCQAMRWLRRMLLRATGLLPRVNIFKSIAVAVLRERSSIGS